MNARFAPETLHPLASTMRQRIETAIEGLVAILDAMDDDPDFEPDSDGEPSLGWSGDRADCFGFEFSDDREADAGDEGEPDEENEPCLGSSGDMDQTNWSQGYGHLNGEHEPSLGWQNTGSQLPHILAGPTPRTSGLQDLDLDREQDTL